jgi:cellulose synthase/poly-beta-1,6-N-acetylglucosamine synthase-like glycosyltransferase
MISFIVPAHNEQAEIGRTLRAIDDAARVVGQPYEIIVVDDASTDATAEVARQHNATLLPVNHRQIAATRNSGARAAQGEQLLFVDADTIISHGVLASALRSMDKGAVGGGAPARFEADAPLYARLLLLWFGLAMRIAGISGGAFMFCTREVFRTVGGFDERFFGAEDAAMSWALKREGRFVVLWKYVSTSGRRMRGFRGVQMVTILIRMAFLPSTLTRRSPVEHIWYESKREDEKKISDSLAVQTLNAVMLLITLAMISGPIWNLSPIPWNTPLGQIKLGIAILNCHFGLLAWPCAYFCFRYLLRQNRWLERMRLVALTAVCLWCAWSTTPVVIWFWTSLYQRLTHFLTA